MTVSRSQPSSGHTPLPWTIEFNEKSGRFSFLGKLGNGNVRASDGYGTMFSVDVSVLDDRDECRFPRVDPELAANVSLIFEAVNSYAALKARVAELENEIALAAEYLQKHAARRTIMLGQTSWTPKRSTVEADRNAFVSVENTLRSALQRKAGS
jgi:hypothetical protein